MRWLRWAHSNLRICARADVIASRPVEERDLSLHVAPTVRYRQPEEERHG
jgi:hypothetical protein